MLGCLPPPCFGFLFEKLSGSTKATKRKRLVPYWPVLLSPSPHSPSSSGCSLIFREICMFFYCIHASGPTRSGSYRKYPLIMQFTTHTCPSVNLLLVGYSNPLRFPEILSSKFSPYYVIIFSDILRYSSNFTCYSYRLVHFSARIPLRNCSCRWPFSAQACHYFPPGHH